MTDSTDLNLPPSSSWNIEQFSLLNPSRFKLVINLFRDTAFWAQSFNIPEVVMGANKVSTSSSIDFWTPGDKVLYEDLHLTLMLDRDLLAYRILKEWQENIVNSQVKRQELYSDMQVILLTGNLNANLSLSFKDCYPQLLSGVQMGAPISPDAPLTVNVTFKFSHFVIDPLVAPDPATP